MLKHVLLSTEEQFCIYLIIINIQLWSLSYILQRYSLRFIFNVWKTDCNINKIKYILTRYSSVLVCVLCVRCVCETEREREVKEERAAVGRRVEGGLYSFLFNFTLIFSTFFFGHHGARKIQWSKVLHKNYKPNTPKDSYFHTASCYS